MQQAQPSNAPANSAFRKAILNRLAILGANSNLKLKGKGHLQIPVPPMPKPEDFGILPEPKLKIPGPRQPKGAYKPSQKYPPPPAENLEE